MAAVNISLLKLRETNEPSEAVANASMVTALDAADGALVQWDERDEKITLLLQNSASSEGTAMVKAGNGYGGVADLEVKIPASSFVILALDSARFKNVSGEKKGKVHITGPATIKVAAFKLP
jgi:hypothetical protein